MRWLFPLFLAFTHQVAFAQYNVPAPATGSHRESSVKIASDDYDGGTIAKDDDDMGQEVGASLDFITRDGASMQRAFKFTDVVLFRLHTLVAVGDSTEIFAGVDLLPKQPSDTEESKWQSAMLGVRHTINRHFAAYARGSGGPLIDNKGLWAAGEAAVQASKHLAERFLFWESAIGGEYTRMFPEDNAKLWNAELLVQTGLALRDRRGFFAGWLNFGFHFPLAHRGRMEVPGATPDVVEMQDMNPQTRVGVSLGALVGVTRGLDLFIEF